MSPARIGVSVLMLVLAAGDTFASALTAAYRLNALRLAEFLGRFTPGDDYRRLIPLMEGLPLWLHALWLLAAACYVLAISRLLSRASFAWVPVLIALALEVTAERNAKPLILAIGVAANPNPSTLAVALPILLPLLLAAAIWTADLNCREKLTH